MKQISAFYSQVQSQYGRYLIYGCPSTADLVLELTYLKRVWNVVEMNFPTITVTSFGCSQINLFKIFFLLFVPSDT